MKVKIKFECFLPEHPQARFTGYGTPQPVDLTEDEAIASRDEFADRFLNDRILGIQIFTEYGDLLVFSKSFFKNYNPVWTVSVAYF